MCLRAFRESVSFYTDHTLRDEEISKTFGLNEAGMVKCFVNHGWENALRDFYLRYKALHREITEPYPEIRQLIPWLKENGALVALITRKGEDCCGVSLQALRMEKTFDEALCGEEWFGSKGKTWNGF